MRKLILALLFCVCAPTAYAQVQRLVSTNFNGLGAPPNGYARYCTNCQKVNPCVAGGTGAVALRIAGAWDCSAGGGTGGVVSDGDKGDITVSASGATYTVDTGLNAAKIGGGGVSTTEFDFLGTLTSNAQTQLDAKAALASPTFTGVPLAPTAAAATNTTQIATTAHVFAERSNTFSLTAKTIDGDLNTVLDLPASTVFKAGTIIPPANILTVVNSRCVRINGSGVLEAHSGDCGSGGGGGDALVANPLSQFAATTSAQLRGVLNDELGTGAALFDGATPTGLVLTNATGTAAGLTAGAGDSATSFFSAGALEKARQHANTLYTDDAQTITVAKTFNTATLIATRPRFLTSIDDNAGNPVIGITPTASSVNYLNITPTATGSGPTLSAVGSDTDIDINILPKGAGVVNIGGGSTTYLNLLASVAPSTPAAGIGTFYIDSTSKNLAVKDDAGVVKHGIQTRTATANNWIRSIAADGSSTISQPAFTDISGSATDAQVPNNVTIDLATLATTVTTNANLTGHVTSSGNAAVLGSFTHAQLNTAVSDADLARTDAANTFTGVQTMTSPVLVTPALGTPASGVVTNLTGTLTNIVYDAAATGNTFTSTFQPWFPAAGCNNATASSFYDLGTSLAPTPACKNSSSGTAAQDAALDFPDSDGMFFAVSNTMLPSDFSGTVDATIKWISAATSGDVIWNLSTICVADGEVDNPNFNTASTVTDTAKGTTLQANHAAITTVTVTGCAANEEMYFKISRDRTTSGDTITGVVSFLGLRLTTTRAQ